MSLPLYVPRSLDTRSPSAAPAARATRPCDDRSIDVLFALVPFVSLERPSVALGTLTACLAAAGVSARTIYANLLFAERIGLGAYEGVNNSDITLQMGEWLFSEAAFRTQVRDVDAYIENLQRQGFSATMFKNDLLRIRALARDFIDDLAAQIVAERPRIVGCSSVFQQNCASLALLRRIRELDPLIVTMMGGANCEGAMGAVTHQQYDWVDYVVSGEADKLLPELCHLVFEHGRDVPADQLPYGALGPAMRTGGGARLLDDGAASGRADARQSAPRALVENLDELPIPRFDDYFEQLERSPLRDSVLPCITIETSRGCWWGAKHHCTFCGLNGAGMAFRSKSEHRVLEEVRSLSERHGIKKIMTVDNILDNRYFAGVMPALSKLEGMRFFYEIKANLSRPQVELLSRAGVRWVQPGIEALHDDLLSLLKKGCTASANVQLLKWARTYGIWVIWNHLCGAPGDRPEWYEQIADWLPLIAHLQPPTSRDITQIRFDRFSPYFNSAEAFGLKLVPYWAYEHTYPLEAQHLKELAYFFCHDGPAAPLPGRLARAVGEWASLFYQQPTRANGLPRMSNSAPELSMRSDGDRLILRDTRPCATSQRHDLDVLESRVCRASDAAKSAQGIVDALRRDGCTETDEAIRAALDRLVTWKIVADFAGRFLCLATDDPAVPYLGFEEFAGGLTLLSGPRRRQRPAPHVDPWDTPLRELF